MLPSSLDAASCPFQDRDVVRATRNFVYSLMVELFVILVLAGGAAWWFFSRESAQQLRQPSEISTSVAQTATNPDSAWWNAGCREASRIHGQRWGSPNLMVPDIAAARANGDTALALALCYEAINKVDNNYGNGGPGQAGPNAHGRDPGTPISRLVDLDWDFCSPVAQLVTEAIETHPGVLTDNGFTYNVKSMAAYLERNGLARGSDQHVRWAREIREALEA